MAKPRTRVSEKIEGSEQIVSMVMGILVVLIVGGLAYRYFQNKGTVTDNIVGEEIGEEAQDLASDEISGEKVRFEDGKTVHTVSKGENLWQIAERYFQSGYNWVDIAEENNLQDPNGLLIGQELRIPDVESKKTTTAVAPETSSDTKGGIIITGGEYTTQKGDYLSLIAKNAYGSGAEWTRIWEANKDQISNPNLIFSGQNLKIPR